MGRNNHQLLLELDIKTIKTLGVKVEEDFYKELSDFCSKHEIKLSSVLCEGATIYMKLARGNTPTEQRKLYRDEFLMLALDHVMQQEYPAAREVLHEEAQRRTEALNVSA
jgi:predicted DNA-binding protein with PD1-like motif